MKRKYHDLHFFLHPNTRVYNQPIYFFSQNAT